VSPIVLWEFLRFLYTGDIVNLDIRVEELFVVADKYDVPTLTDICEKRLMQKLSMKNATRVLTLAHEYDREELKSRALAFIKSRNHHPVMWSKLVGNSKAIKLVWDKYSCTRPASPLDN